MGETAPIRTTDYLTALDVNVLTAVFGAPVERDDHFVAAALIAHSGTSWDAKALPRSEDDALSVPIQCLIQSVVHEGLQTTPMGWAISQAAGWITVDVLILKPISE